MATHQKSALGELRRANPVSSEAAGLAEACGRVRAQIESRLRAGDGVGSESYDGTGPERRSSSRRRRLVYGLAMAAAVVVAAPALGIRPSALPFFGADKADAPTQLEFASLGVGAPQGMDPRAIASEARKIRLGHFGGRSHTLYVAPTARGGFCYLWTPGYGGCDATGEQTLDVVGELRSATGPLTAPMPPGSMVRADDARAQAAHAEAVVPTWVVGFVRTDDAETVRIRFKDGSSVQPEVTWVSEPIGAGFFAYEIPKTRQGLSTRAVAVDAVASGGASVKEQLLVPAR